MDRARDIFLGALDLREPERRAFVRRACGDDEKLFELVSELLIHHREATILDVATGTQMAARPRGLTSLRPLLTALSAISGTRSKRIAVGVALLTAFVVLSWVVRTAARRMAAGQAFSTLAAIEANNTSAIRAMIAEWKRSNEVTVAEGSGREAALAVIARPSQANWRRFNIFASHIVAGVPDSRYAMSDAAGTLLEGSSPTFANRTTNERGAAMLARLAETGETLVRVLGTHRALRGVAGEGSLVPQILVATPIFFDAGKQRLAGAFVTTRPMDPLSQALAKMRIFESGESYLFSREGAMLTPTRFQPEMRRWGLVHDPAIGTGTSFVELRDPGRRLQDTGGKRPDEDPSVWPATMVVRTVQSAAENTDKPQAGQIREPYRDYRGELVVSSWRWLPELDAAFVTEVDAGEMTVVADLFDRVLFSLLALVAAGGIWAFLSSGWILRMRQELRGDEIGQYSLVEKIGEGGMGEVYLARHPLLKRLSALKLLRRDRMDPVSQALFRNEVQIASRLVHPNTVEIYDFGQARDGAFFCVMQYLPGRDLGELVNKVGSLAAPRVVHIARQICGALAEAHGEGLLHGDVKPSNVMLCPLGGTYDVAKLLDFGIARRIRPAGSETGPLARSGTPYYTAPEMLSGDVSADGRSDVYSLGVLCYFLLAGRLPQPPGLPWIEAVLTREPLQLGKLVPVPEGLGSLVMRCISRDPDKRPGSAAELEAELDGLARAMPWTNDDAKKAWGAQIERGS